MEVGSIAKWLKQEGEAVNAGDVICQVETDKAVVDFEAQDDTFLAKILKGEGSGEIKVGEPICVTVNEVDDVAAFKDFTLDGAAALPASEPAAAKPAEAAPAPAAPAASPAAAPAASSAPGGRVIASPLAKKIARESGAVLSVINGSGPHGRIVKADVEAALASGQAAPAESAAAETAAPQATAAPASPSVGGDYVDYPISAEAQALGQQLAQQKLEVPHYHLTVDLTLDKLLDARARLNAGRGPEEQLSVNDFIVRAVSLAMRQVPDANSVWKGSFIRQYNDVNVNLIVSTAAGGAVAPVIKHVNRKGLSDISKDVNELVAKANDSTLSGEDVATGTFTVSNVGMYDVKSLAGIVRPEQGCLLGLGTIEKKVVPNDGTFLAALGWKDGSVLRWDTDCWRLWHAQTRTRSRSTSTRR